MAHDVVYKHASDELNYEVDFTSELPDDTSVTASSAVSAVDSSGAAAASVVGTAAQSGMILSCPLIAGTDGEDYTVTFTGRGNSTSRDRSRIIELRVRNTAQGNV